MATVMYVPYILQQINDYLDYRTQIIFSTVNHATTQNLITALTIKMFNVVKGDHIKKIIDKFDSKHSISNIKKLSISVNPGVFDFGTLDRFTSLESFGITYNYNECFDIDKMPNLCSLTIKCTMPHNMQHNMAYNNYRASNTFMTITNKHHNYDNVKNITLKNVKPTLISDKFPNLEK